ncbi:MAG TPA: DUF4397 domain-containing protein [Micromonosporaceae bacterium]|nr:DUF4397 domain-containing protein [Micromonosporaceae bacterium]
MRTRMISGALGALAALAAGGVAVLSTAGPAAAAGSSKVYVVHGIPGQTVDVYVNGEKALPGFEPTKVAGPLDLPEGAYDIVLTRPGEPVTSPILSVQDARVPGGQNISLVAHLKADGQPTLTPFVNDVSKLGAGKARLVVRHTAAAPAVDVRAGGQPVFPGLANPREAKADIDAGSVRADVVLAGSQTVVLGPANLDLAEGTATVVYAIGSAEAQSLAITSQALTGLHSTPGVIAAGDGGLADQRLPLWWYPVAFAGLALVVAAVVTARRSVAAARAPRR